MKTFIRLLGFINFFKYLSSILKKGAQILQKLTTLKYETPEGWHDANSVLKTHKY
jgi:hypothetical protein